MRASLRFVASLLALAMIVFTCASPVRAQVTLVGSGTFNGGAVTGVTSFLDTTNFSWKNTADTTKVVQVDASNVTTGNTAVGLYFAGTSTTPELWIGQSTAANKVKILHDGSNGYINSAVGELRLQSVATNVALFSATGSVGVRVQGVDLQLCDASASNCSILNREAAGTVQLGQDVNGSPVNQTLKAHDGITGTDVKGASLTLEPGLGTGAGVSNPLTLNRVVTKATGTTAQTYAPVIVACPTKILSNTSATVQTVATVTTTSTTGGNVTMDYTVVANNGTLQDVDGGLVKVGWNNNAGTVAAAMTAVALQSDSDASGTLAATPTATVATNVVSIKLTPTWVTIVPTTVTALITFTLGTTGDTVVCQ